MSRPLKILVLLLPFMLTACSTQKLVPPEPPQMLLLPPAEIAQELLLKQKITFRAGGRQQSFLTVGRLQQERLKLVMLLPAGQPFLTLDYDGQNLSQENQSSVELPGKDILASIQFWLWPKQSLLLHYPPEDGWRVEFNGDDRTLLTPSGVLLKITRQSDKTLIVDNHLHNYQVIIQILEQTEL